MILINVTEGLGLAGAAPFACLVLVSLSKIYFSVKNPNDIPQYIENLKNLFKNDNKLKRIYKKYNRDSININLYVDITRDIPKLFKYHKKSNRYQWNNSI